MRLRREVLQIMANSSGDPKRDNGKRLGDFQTFLREPLPTRRSSDLDPSPYAPVSRLFWNEFYVDIERASDFAECAPAQKKLQSAAFRQRLNEATRRRCVDYEK